ncbi:MAG TPA: adenylate/guanylate cyclase domain-containing protein [Candidatus Acidoferrales bacterium]|nr:adenylate/guanylate cyclase domain-containing protein [Candidatus Acidoferrales bacterium]
MATPADQASRDRLLYQVAAELTSSLDLDEVLAKVMDRVIDLMKAARGFIVLVDQETNTMSVRVSRGEADEEKSKQFLGSKTVVEQVVVAGQAVVSTDASLDERFKGQQSVILQNLRSIIAVPLVTKGKVIGAVYVDNPFRAGIFEDKDKEFLQAIADLAAIAIDNARLYGELKSNFEHTQYLKTTFERYVNKSVTDWVLADPNRNTVFVPGQRLRVTMLMTDIAGFSSLSQEMQAEELVDFLNSYYKRMVEIVLAHGGNIDKFQGDGLLVAFGAPMPFEDHAQRAVAAARAMLAEVAAINAERQKVGDPPISVGMGMDTGYVVAGNVGSERRLEYTLIGIPVNNAAFLSKVRPAAVLMSQNTYRQLGGEIPVVPRDPIVLKGGVREVPIYLLDTSPPVPADKPAATDKPTG